MLYISNTSQILAVWMLEMFFQEDERKILGINLQRIGNALEGRGGGCGGGGAGTIICRFVKHNYSCALRSTHRIKR